MVNHRPWTPNQADYQAIFQDQNPWRLFTFDLKKDLDALAPTTERSIVPFLAKQIQDKSLKRFQLLFGPRRVGKTTAMLQTVRQLLREGIPPQRLLWLRLDHPLLMTIPLGNLIELVLPNIRTTKDIHYLFLDEITYAANWDSWLKTFYDDHWPIQIIGTSSATSALRDKRHESGIGRWTEQFMMPYLFGEYLELINKPRQLESKGSLYATISGLDPALGEAEDNPDLQNYLLMGGFPELILLNQESSDRMQNLSRSQRILQADALERAIYKDIPQVYGVDNPLKLEQLTYTLAGQIGGILSSKNLSDNLQISMLTIDRYMMFLSQAFIIFTLSAYSGSETSIQKRGRKLYFWEGAIRNAALQRGRTPLSNPDEFGILIENSAASHLKALGDLTNIRVHYFRDGKDEVDLIFDDPQEPMAFEISTTINHHRKGLKALIKRAPKFKGRSYLVTYAGRALISAESTPDGIGIIPYDLYVLAINSEVERLRKI